MRKADASELVNNPAFGAAFDDYRTGLFKQWANESDPEQRDAIYHRMAASKEVEKSIRNRAIDNDD